MRIWNQMQMISESLQEPHQFLLVCFAYPSAPENVMECLAVQIFVDGVRDNETQRALRLARP